jgi:hypothetical protein
MAKLRARTIQYTRVVALRHYESWAIQGGPLRGELGSSNSKLWSWRVWDALGGKTIDRGFERGKRRAKAEMFRVLDETAISMDLGEVTRVA